MRDPGRYQEAFMFWNQKNPELRSMLLNHDADELDRNERPEILAYLPPLQGTDVLDLAAGIGRFTGEFAKTCRSVAALDFNPLFLKENEKNNSHFSNIAFHCKDALDADFKPSSFDLVFISWLFMYLTDSEAVHLAANIVRWLKPGGHLFFRESCAPKRTASTNEGYPTASRDSGSIANRLLTGAVNRWPRFNKWNLRFSFLFSPSV